MACYPVWVSDSVTVLRGVRSGAAIGKRRVSPGLVSAVRSAVRGNEPTDCVPAPRDGRRDAQGGQELSNRLSIAAVLGAVTLYAHVFGAVPHDTMIRDAVDVIEVNHFYDDCGRHVFDQQIFWDWSGTRYQVVAWRLIKSPEMLPHRDWKRGGYVAMWRDNETLREVRAPAIRETWTQYDPELAERQVLPQEQRRHLTKSHSTP